MNEPIQHLFYGEYPIVVGGPQPSGDELQQRLGLAKKRLLFVQFIGTRGTDRKV
jgi:hypothetical protein